VENGEEIDPVIRAQLERIDQKFLVLSHYFSLSLIFSAQYEEQWSTFALSFLWEIRHLPKFLETHRIVRDRMVQLVISYKKFCNEGKELDKKLVKSLIQLNYLFSSELREDVRIDETLFGRANLETQTKNFLAQVITSHLQTTSTVIVGTNEKLITEWIDSLSLFLLPHQRNISRSKVEYGKEHYIPDLALQGLKCSPEEITNKLKKITDIHNSSCSQYRFLIHSKWII